MSGSVYSPLKMARLALREGYPPAAPTQVQLILSDLCNEDCNWCAYRLTNYTSAQNFVGTSPLSKYGHNNPIRFIPIERVISLLDEFKAAGVKGLQLTGGGEPSTHKDFDFILRRALDHGFACALVSNGLKWSERAIDCLRDFSWVRVSLDAGTSETYARTRGTQTANFNRVLDNTARLATLIQRHSTSCVLGVGYVVTPENYTEIVLGTALAVASGAQNIRLSAAFSPDDEKPFTTIYSEIRAIIDEAKAEWGNRIVIHDLFGDRIGDLKLHNPDYRSCAKMRYTAYVGGDLKTYTCCVYAYNSRGEIAGGDLTTRRFDEFWMSPERKKFMDSFDARGCVRCMFNESNRTMDYLTHPDDPPHMEFP